MGEVVQMKPKAKVRERKEVEVNWGMVGAIGFCLMFWGTVFETTRRFWWGQ